MKHLATDAPDEWSSSVLAPKGRGHGQNPAYRPTGSFFGRREVKGGDNAITEINLKPDATHIELPDGSVITGQTTYTLADVSTGIVANTTLAAEAKGYTVVQTVATAADGSKTTTTKAYDTGGTLAFAIVSTSNATGTEINTSYDDNGDGTTDRLQTISTQIISGVKTELETNSIGATAADAVLSHRQQTVTSADGKVITISRDSTGGGWWDSKEVRTTLADGSRTILMQDLAQDGTTVIRSSFETVSITGLVRSEAMDLDGDTDTDATAGHTITTDANGVRVETITTHNGDGTYDVVTSDVTTFNGCERTENLVVSNDDGSIQLKQKTVLSADKVARETWRLAA